jgi:hypothetical protein
MKPLSNPTFQLEQKTTNIIVLIVGLLPFLFFAFLLEDYLSKYFNIPFLSLITMLPFLSCIAT